MEYIKVAKVEDVILHKRGTATIGTLHLTTHHLIFTGKSLNNEFWLPYPLIGSVFKNKGSALILAKDKRPKEQNIQNVVSNQDLWSLVNIKIVCKDYTVFSLDFADLVEARDVFESLEKLTVVADIRQLYAFIYTPSENELHWDGWTLYNVKKEFSRQGLKLDSQDTAWRVSTVNHDYTFSRTYPRELIVPQLASDSLLRHAAKFRSQNRIPILAYYHRQTRCCIVRSAQPLPGLTKQRSIQDEKLTLESLKSSCCTSSKNLIVDARPIANALGQSALGGGTENMDYYGFDNTCKRIFLGIDNIHVMSETLNYMVETYLVDGDLNLPLNKTAMNAGKAANWLKYIKSLLRSTETLVKHILFNKSNILIHCSDGWDRTAQVCSLIQISLDPYYRTMEGFMVLVEKDWVSSGHKFQDRCNHTSCGKIFHDNTTHFTNRSEVKPGTYLFNKEDTSNEFEGCQQTSGSNMGVSTDFLNKFASAFRYSNNKDKKAMKFASPIFQQFLDCVYQLMNQNPDLFEFNERFLRRLVYHLYSCQYGTFLCNSEKERVETGIYKNTHSVWNYFHSRPDEFKNKNYHPQQHSDDWVLPDLTKIQWWWQLYNRKDNEMNNTMPESVTPDSKNQDMASLTMSSKDGSKKVFPFSIDIFGKR